MSPGHGPSAIINHPSCTPLTVALASASPALQFPRVFVSCSPAIAAAVTPLAHGPAFRLPPPPATDCRCDAIPPPAVTSFHTSSLLPVSRLDDVTQRRETPSSPAATDHVVLMADDRTGGRLDNDVILSVKEPVDIDNVGSDTSMRETE